MENVGDRHYKQCLTRMTASLKQSIIFLNIIKVRRPVAYINIHKLYFPFLRVCIRHNFQIHCTKISSYRIKEHWPNYILLVHRFTSVCEKPNDEGNSFS